MKKEIIERIEKVVSALEPELKKLATDIHKNPELGNNEIKASKWQVDLLKKYGFIVQSGFCGFDTAYKAVYKGRKNGPKIGMLSEYDALPGLGHACGHNLICMMSVGAGIAMREFADEFGAEIQVIGTPAEESAGAKVKMSDLGAFDELDVAMMAHPAYIDTDSLNSCAIKCFQVEFFGRTAHAAAAPHEGINALDAMIQLFVSVGLLRQQTKPDARIHGIIQDGGKVPNIIPDYTKALFYTRAPKFTYAVELAEKIYAAARGAATATGCRVRIEDAEEDFKDTCANQYLAALVSDNLEKYWGHKVYRLKGTPIPGGSDLGNVSYRCPAIQLTASLSEKGNEERYSPHTTEFAEKAGTDAAMNNCLEFVKAFSLTAFQLMTEPEHLNAIKEEFTHVNEERNTQGIRMPW